MQARTIQRVLVACRGAEAAELCAAVEAAGTESVAVYADADAEAAHLDVAAWAARIATEPGADPYADAGRIVGAALDAGADAVLPGSSGAGRDGDFARIVLAMGLAYVGPRPDELDACADRAAVRQCGRDAGIEPVPGSPALEDPDAVRAWLARLRGPVYVRPARRGAGPALRVEGVEAGVVAARAIGGPVIVERAVLPSRHVVVAVLGDGEGNAITVGDHERSLAHDGHVRVRECPAPALDDDLRDRLVVAAERVAGALRHLGPGAVEFLVGPDGTPWLHDFDPGVFRGFGLHDAVYGLSFVGAAIRIAAGEALGWDPDEILPGRAAVEVELRATGPGELEDVSLPEGVEVSTAVAAGSRIDPARDAVLATLRVTGPTRHAALVRAHAAVEGASFDGVPTDAALVLRVLADSRTWAGRTSPEVFATAERE